jgi:hypothetical protein
LEGTLLIVVQKFLAAVHVSADKFVLSELSSAGIEGGLSGHYNQPGGAAAAADAVGATGSGRRAASALHVGGAGRAGGGGGGGGRRGIRSAAAAHKQNAMRSSSIPLQIYSAATVGVMLAGQLLLRGVGNHPLSAQDRTAVLNFITRSQPVLQDVSSLYALDVLSVGLFDAYTRKQQLSDHITPSAVVQEAIQGTQDPHIFGASSRNGENETNLFSDLQQVSSSLQSLLVKLLATYQISNRYDINFFFIYNIICVCRNQIVLLHLVFLY